MNNNRTARLLQAQLAVLLLTVLLVASPAFAGDVKLSIANGRVILFAQDATLGQILGEWERIGNTRVINREKLPTRLVTLALADETESQALAVLLRSLGGYVAVRRAPFAPGTSVFDRIIILSGETPPLARVSSGAQATAPQQPSDGRGRIQRRVLADGRVVSFVESPERPGEISIVEDNGAGEQSSAGAGRTAGQVAPDQVNPDPLVGPGGRGIQLPAGGSARGTGLGQPSVLQGGQFSADPYNLQPPVGGVPPATATSPVSPGAATKPGAPVSGQKPPGPPKGPGGESA